MNRNQEIKEDKYNTYYIVTKLSSILKTDLIYTKIVL